MINGIKVKGSDAARTSRIAYASGGAVNGRSTMAGSKYTTENNSPPGADRDEMKAGGRAGKKHKGKAHVHININTVAPNSPPGGGMPMPPPDMSAMGGAGGPPPMPPPGPGPAPMGAPPPMKTGGVVKQGGGRSGVGRLEKAKKANIPTRKGMFE